METTATPKHGVREIFALYGPEYRKEHKLPEQQRKAMYALENCRTAALGGHVDQCEHCGYTHTFYNSCRNRHCPLCQKLNGEKWADKLGETLLPVRYFHVVFTIPCELNRLALVNQEVVYNILFKAASQTILTLAKDPKHHGVISGLIAVLHTWGQNLMDHPHLHTIVPAGGWSEMAQCWKPTSKKFFVAGKVMSLMFRGKFLAFLKEAYNEKQFKFAGEIKSIESKTEFKKFLNVLYEKKWVVNCETSFKGPTNIVKYLARYTHRVAIDNSRILSVENDNVNFLWKDYKNHGLTKPMQLAAPEFIRRFLLHILPKGFCKIRYYGIFASRNRAALLSKCRTAIGKPMTASKYKGLTWQEVLFKACGVNVTQCPACLIGKMKIILVMENFRGPPKTNPANVL